MVDIKLQERKIIFNRYTDFLLWIFTKINKIWFDFSKTYCTLYWSSQSVTFTLKRCTLNSETIFDIGKLFKNDNKYFLFHLKISFRSKDFQIFVLNCGHVEKRFHKKIRSILKFMTSQPGKQTIAIHILPNTSKSKGNQTMKFSQLIEHNMRNIFLVKAYQK